MRWRLPRRTCWVEVHPGSQSVAWRRICLTKLTVWFHTEGSQWKRRILERYIQRKQFGARMGQLQGGRLSLCYSYRFTIMYWPMLFQHIDDYMILSSLLRCEKESLWLIFNYECTSAQYYINNDLPDNMAQYNLTYVRKHSLYTDQYRICWQYA